MLVRSARLFSVLMLALLALLVAPALPAAGAPAAQQDAVAPAVAWIVTQQQPDGSFTGFGAGSTADAMLALAAAGQNPAALAGAGATPIDYLSGQARELAADPGLAAKVSIALLVSGRSPHSALGVNLIEAINGGYDPVSGQYGADVTAHVLSLLALRADGAEVPAEALAWLAAAQLDDGSWSFSGDRTPGGGDTNTTALAIQALVAHGQQDSEQVSRAIAYLQTQQNADGGFPYSQSSSYGTESDANSTANVIQAIIAVGQDPNSWSRDGATPISRLLAFQNESGAFRYQDAVPEDNQLATYQAVPALLGVSYPLEPLVIIQQPEPTADPAASPTVVPTPDVGTVQPTPTSGPVQPPAELPNTGSGDEGGIVLVIGALLLAFSGLLLRRRPFSRS